MTRSLLVFSWAGAATAAASTSVRARTCRIDLLMGASRSPAAGRAPGGPSRRSSPARGADLRVDQGAHELRGEAGLLVGVLDADRPAVDDGQLVAQLVAEVA